MTDDKKNARRASVLRRKAEETVASQSPPSETFTSELDAKRLLHELQVHQVELEIQNEELQRTKDLQATSLQRYCNLYDLAPFGYVTLDSEGLILDANLAAANMLLLARSALVKQPLSRFIIKEHLDIYDQQRKQCFDSSTQQIWEMRLARTDSSLFWAQFQAAPSFGGEYWISFHDISRRKLIEQELLTTTYNLNTTLNATVDGILAVDMDGNVLFRNQRFAEMWGIPANVLESGDDNIMLDFVLPQLSDPDAFLQTVRKRYNSDEISFDVIELHDGRVFERYSLPMRQEDELRFGRVWSFRDITERNKTEDALKESYELLETRVAERTEALNRSLEQTRNVSLELAWAEDRERERIAGELHDRVGQSLLLAKMKLDAMANNIISDSLHKAAVEASSLLATSIHDIRTLTFRLRPPILDNAGIETALEWLCSSMGDDYSLQIDFKDDRQPKPLSAEVKYSLYQAVRELLLNVAKHAGIEKAQLSIKTNDNTIEIHVKDNGAGFNLTEAEKNNFTTNGYGLHNVKQRVELMGGIFAVESELGMGTSATLMVPFTEDQQQQGLARLSKSRSFDEQTVHETGPPLPCQLRDGLQKPTTILLVDDHLIFREGLRSLIENGKAGVVIGEAGDGAEAVRLAGELEPDLVIMDLTMPVMNGIEATREITTKYPDIRVIALSMERDRFFIVEALKAGASGYLPKDTAFAGILDAITTVASGENYVPPNISSLLIKEFLHRIPEDMAPGYAVLTRREREILQLVAEGKSIKEIAFTLDVSSKTVENLRHALMEKLQLFNVAELTKFAIRHGLTSNK